MSNSCRLLTTVVFREEMPVQSPVLQMGSRWVLLYHDANTADQFGLALPLEMIVCCFVVFMQPKLRIGDCRFRSGKGAGDSP